MHRECSHEIVEVGNTSCSFFPLPRLGGWRDLLPNIFMGVLDVGAQGAVVLPEGSVVSDLHHPQNVDID